MSIQTAYTPTALRRALYAISSIVVVMIVGIIGFHYIEGMNYINALYFESMLATGQGPPLALTTDTGKVFASIMAFVSIGSVITSLVYTLGPIIAAIWRETLERAERETTRLKQDVVQEERKLLDALDPKDADE